MENDRMPGGSGTPNGSLEPNAFNGTPCAMTGVAGLDAILGGGLPRNHTYIIQGEHGAGKTTLGMQFCIAGAQQGERALYLSLCESKRELHEVAHAHGWSLGDLVIHHFDPREILGDSPAQSVFHSVEVELPKTIENLLSVIDQTKPHRLVLDPLTDIRLLASNPRWFHLQLLALSNYLMDRQCTVLLCDDQPHFGTPGYSIAHGVIHLEQLARDYGPDRRRLRIAKLRGRDFDSGYHDYKILSGGIEVYPHLYPAVPGPVGRGDLVASGISELDALFGGGLERSTSTLLLGPAGTGKSTLASQYAVAAASRNERSALYIFDERIQTLITRTNSMHIDLEGAIHRGFVDLRQIDPAALTPGEFSYMVQKAVTEQDVRLVVIDSLAGYVFAMPHEKLLVLHLHELLNFLNQRKVTVLMIMTKHGLPGTSHQPPFDTSYIADSILLFHSFEYAGEIRKAISVHKHRSGMHERTLRELQFNDQGICIGRPLHQFHGILTGTPHFVGDALPDVRDTERI